MVHIDSAVLEDERLERLSLAAQVMWFHILVFCAELRVDRITAKRVRVLNERVERREEGACGFKRTWHSPLAELCKDGILHFEDDHYRLVDAVRPSRRYLTIPVAEGGYWAPSEELKEELFELCPEAGEKTQALARQIEVGELKPPKRRGAARWLKHRLVESRGVQFPKALLEAVPEIESLWKERIKLARSSNVSLSVPVQNKQLQVLESWLDEIGAAGVRKSIEDAAAGAWRNIFRPKGNYRSWGRVDAGRSVPARDGIEF